MQEVVNMYQEYFDRHMQRDLWISDYLDLITWAVIWLIGYKQLVSYSWRS